MTELNTGVAASMEDGVLRLTPRCDLLASTAGRLREEMQREMSGAQTAVVLDLNGIRQVDSLGVSLVVGLFKTCSARGLKFSVENASADIARVFRLFTLDKFFPVTEAAR